LIRLVKWLAILFGILVLFTAALLYVKRPHTPPIRGSEGGSIASLEQVELGGIKQWILIRGYDTSNPMLVFLHGGPGMPAMYLAHAFQRPLEEDFIVVQWDRRGAGKTFSDSLMPEDLSVSQLLSDTRELVEYLRSRFDVDKIYLAGHSFGSYLGMLFADRYPEFLNAYIGIGQVVDPERAQEIQDGFIRQQLQQSANEEAIAELDSLGPAVYEHWLFEFGGELHDAKSWWPLLWTGFLAPEYGLADVAKVPRGSSFSSRHMTNDVIEDPLISEVDTVSVPVYFFSGRFDYTTPFELVQEYYEALDAPYKEMVWFDESAHFPFFEQPEEFAREMKNILDQPPVQE